MTTPEEVEALRAQLRLARGLHEGAMKQAREYRARIDAARALIDGDRAVSIEELRAVLDGDA
jgi:ABC-type Na+ transport system ATPase subunit NatA